ncbi:MAG: ABC transporter permease subunit [Planctomycetes bacterium]|nr:ABC transporter permease subunit [Planctomycetota bacterium]
MNRLSRINTVWRKELKDTLRDRRTVIAMVLVPMVLYPALMLGSLQAFELQTTRLKQESYDVGVASEQAARWLRKLVDADPARRALAAGLTPEQLSAEQVVEQAEAEGFGSEAKPAVTQGESATEAARSDVRRVPPAYRIVIVADVVAAVEGGQTHAGILVEGGLPAPDNVRSAHITLVSDQSEIRSQIAAAGLDGILQRANAQMVLHRLRELALDPELLRPLDLTEQDVATPEKLGSSVIGQIVPLILIVMTITGAIYPAIDLTAGERERGTLETLMVAPVPTVDLIAGKFVVVTAIGMLSAVLNLVSIGGTIYLGGLGDMLTQGNGVAFPLWALPWVLLLLLPLAVMFSALLLAVCSFARSFKEAQNYIMPVMIAALIPAVAGILPGMRLEGPVLVIPVTNVVVLTRELFMGRFNVVGVLWVSFSTCIYAGAAVAVAAKLFGQEAVLFADSGSVKTLFLRRFFKPRLRPSAAQAFLLLALAYPLHFFIQVAIMRSPALMGNVAYFWAFGANLVLLFVLLPVVAAKYMRVDIVQTLRLPRPSAAALLAGLCFGCSTWILGKAWFVLQQNWMPFDTASLRAVEQQFAWLENVSPFAVIFFMAVLPAVCEEVFFRGYVLSGLRRALKPAGAVLVVAIAFGIYHQSLHRLALTAMLGLVLGLLVIQGRSIWPAMLAHMMHNGLSLATATVPACRDLAARFGFEADPFALPPMPFLVGAGALFGAGLTLCALLGRQSLASEPDDVPAERGETPDIGQVSPLTPDLTPTEGKPVASVLRRADANSGATPGQ